MNKQKLIEKFEERKTIIGNFQCYAVWWKDVKEIFEQLDEPQPVKVPQFVADWIEYCKVKKITLAHALYRSEEAKNKSVYRWIVEGSGHQETFARAWLDGYEVEEEKRYRIVVKHTDRNCLKYDKYVRKWFFGIEEISSIVRKDHTRKELEEADFGWVFDCPGIEIEEVE